MDMIAAVASDWGIGKDNDMLFYLKEDLGYFREMTTGKTIILGRKTLDSLPGGKPLKDRRHFVLTRDKSFSREGVEVFHSMESILKAVKEMDEETVMVVGGSEIYHIFLPFCRRAFVTRIEAAVPGTDRFFPDLDKDPEWKLVQISPEKEEAGVRFRFCVYSRE